MIVLLSFVLAAAGPLSFEDAVLALSGASGMEELDASVTERYLLYEQRPLRINVVSRSAMVSSGLLTAFQVASLIDWRSRHGDVLSFTELSTIDGFTPAYVSALRRFVSLESSRPAGERHRDSLTVGWNSSLTAGVRIEDDDGGPLPAFRVKQRLKFGERVEVRWQSRNTYSDRHFGFGTGNVTWYGAGGGRLVTMGKVIAGDFSARFGQGLALWSGFAMSGFSGAGGFVRNSSGLSPSSSFSESLRGVAADFSAGRFVVSAGAGCQGDSESPADFLKKCRGLVNVSFAGSTVSAGLTGLVGFDGTVVASADFRAGFRGGAVYGDFALEKGYRWSGAGVVGVLYVPAYGQRLSGVARFYPSSYGGALASAPRSSTRTSDEHGVSAAWEGYGFNVNADCAWHPSKRSEHYKGMLLWKKELGAGGKVSVTPDLRLTARYRPQESVPLRVDGRAAGTLSLGCWRVGGRGDFALSKGLAWLWYAETGFVRDGNGAAAASLWLRGGVFKVDEWSDRIYVYERDVPGAFSNVAYYGRGWNASLTGSLKLRGDGRLRTGHSLFLRGSVVMYPWNPSPKPGRWEVKVQWVITL